MKHFESLLLLVIALAVGGRLGYKFLPDFKVVKMIIFAIYRLILGKVFYKFGRKYIEITFSLWIKK